MATTGTTERKHHSSNPPTVCVVSGHRSFCRRHVSGAAPAAEAAQCELSTHQLASHRIRSSRQPHGMRRRINYRCLHRHPAHLAPYLLLALLKLHRRLELGDPTLTPAPIAVGRPSLGKIFGESPFCYRAADAQNESLGW
jgi:hypothetical protein